MFYFLIAGLCVVYILVNNKKRKASLTKYIILSILFPPIGFALWQAEKPLIGDERRYGGRGWNFMKWFALMHTLLCILWAFAAMGIGASYIASTSDDAEALGAALGTGLGLTMIMIAWFIGTIGSLILGLILRKPVTESAVGASAHIVG